MSREFSSNLDKDVQTETTNSSACLFDQANADAHSVKWNTLFVQMDKALSEEESHLVRFATRLTRTNMHTCLGSLLTTGIRHSLLAQLFC